MDSNKKVFKILEFILQKKAENPVILELKKISHFCDYFIICSGTTERHVRAIYEDAIIFSKKNKIKIHHAENDSGGRWLLIDYFDIILHIFNEESRSFYGIERLWREAKKIRLPKSIINKLEN